MLPADLVGRVIEAADDGRAVIVLDGKVLDVLPAPWYAPGAFVIRARHVRDGEVTQRTRYWPTEKADRLLRGEAVAS